MKLLEKIQHNKSKIIQDFGVQLDTQFAKVNARRLQAPKIQYANRLIEVINGVWRGEGMQFLMPETANKWAILNANQRTRRNELEELSKMVCIYSNLVKRNSQLFLNKKCNYFLYTYV